MRKLAIFVEGQTEQIFIQRLIEEIAGKKNLTVQLDQLQGGANAPRTTINQLIIKSPEETKYYVLIRDSATDSRVVSDVRDTIHNLHSQGYDRVIGLRDLYPLNIDELQDVEEASNTYIPRNLMPANIIIAVREIETWFLAEINHYQAIHPNLNIPLIDQQLGINIPSINIESIEHPSQTLHSIYKLVGLAYKKSRNQVARTVNALDIENIYLELKNNLDSLSNLINEIDAFLTET